MSVSECMNVYHACTDIPEGQTKALDPLELQAVVSHLRWVLGTEPQCSGRAASDLLSLLIGSHHILTIFSCLLILFLVRSEGTSYLGPGSF